MPQKSVFINRKGAKAPFGSPKMGERRKERKDLKKCCFTFLFAYQKLFVTSHHKKFCKI